MIDEFDLPSSSLERAQALEAILIERATGGTDRGHIYSQLRRDFINDAVLSRLLPAFVRVHRTTDSFWSFIKHEAPTYDERRSLIRAAFTPLFDHLEGVTKAPADPVIDEALESFDSEAVHAVWSKAIARRESDPEGAITLARTLLETVCKRILDARGLHYSDKEDLPKLYSLAAKALSLAPDQHSEEPIRAILGGAMNVVNGLGTLRNRLSDSHGRGGRPVKAQPRHAALAVNMAGTLATFLVETHFAKPPE